MGSGAGADRRLDGNPTFTEYTRQQGEISGSPGSLVHLAGLVVASGARGAGLGAAGVARRPSISRRRSMRRRGLRFAQDRSIPTRASSWPSGLTHEIM